MLQIKILCVEKPCYANKGCQAAEWGEWSEETALALARSEGIDLSQDHWEAIYFLRGYFHERGFHADSQEALCHLEEEFGGRGSRKYLSRLFPDGVIAQGCRIAGLTAFSWTANRASESVH